MSGITRTARFGPSDTAAAILVEIACPACGYLDPAEVSRFGSGRRVRFFCDGCGAFVTVLLTEAQADAVRHLASAD